MDKQKRNEPSRRPASRPGTRYSGRAPQNRASWRDAEIGHSAASPSREAPRRPMPKRRPRRRKNDPVSIALIVGIALLLVLLIALGVRAIINSQGPRVIVKLHETDTPVPTDEISLSDPARDSVTPAPAAEEQTESDTVPEQSAPTAAPAAQTVSYSEADVYGTVTADCTPIPADEFEYLPVYKQVSTDRKVVAITVDDCFQKANLQTILQTVYDAGGKITLFPIGSNIQKLDLGDILKDAFFNHGIEIENHTRDHARVFRMSDEEMRAQIYDQYVILSQALGVNYHEHFLRFMGGDGGEDQRSHNYLTQLGFSGVAHWGCSGSNGDLDHCKENLEPGMIYLFHTTDHDTEILQKFIPWCVEQGYELVTLNELIGLPENETSDLSTLVTEAPEAVPFEWDYKDISFNDYSWRTKMMQVRLGELGYLGEDAKQDGDYTGYYGNMTVDAIKAFQQDNQLQPSGIADALTQRALLDPQ